MREINRNYYNAINRAEWPEWCSGLIKALNGKSWTTGIESDKKLRGSSINVDLYSYDDARELAVVQVRECVFRPGRFNHVRKNYFLIGKNENGLPFAHAIESVARSKKAMETVEGGVLLALSRIWDCSVDDLNDIVRNGDIAFIPAGRLPVDAALVGENSIELRESHHLTTLRDAKIYKSGETYFVKGAAKIEHAKGQHPTARIKGGIWRVQPGIKANGWDFSRPTAD